MSKLENQFEKTISDFQRQAFIDVVRQKPNTTIEDLYKLGEKHSLTNVTLGELLGDKAPRLAPKKTKKGAKKRASVETDGVAVRTADGRASYDESVLEIVKGADGEYVSAQAVRKKVGGTPHQVRKSLNRLIGTGSVSFKGKARATRYAMV